MSTAPASELPWHAAYPKAISKAVFLPRPTVVEWFTSGDKTQGKDFVLVDLRRMDHEGGTIKGSINLPAQTIFHSIPTLYTLLSSAGISAVVFYCQSSTGRGGRAAAWMQDYIGGKKDENLKSYALEGGIKGWVGDGGKLLDLMDGYDAKAWEKQQ